MGGGLNGRRKNKSKIISSKRKEELHQLLIKCIVRDGRSFKDYEKSGMKRLLKEAFPDET